MPSVSVTLAQPQVGDLAIVRHLGTAQLNRLGDALDRMKPTIRRSEFRRAVAEVIGTTEAASAVSRVIFGLALAIRIRNIPPADLLRGIGEFLRSQNWSEGDLLLWHEVGPVIERLIMSPVVALPTKARDLSEDYDRALTAFRILTDIRPVYDDADEIVGVEITQTLRLNYESVLDDTTHTLSFAMDTDDIKALQAACERALKKADAAKALMRTQLGDEVLMPGEA